MSIIPSFNIPQIAPTGPMTFLQQPGGIASLGQYGPTSPLARGLGGVISAPGPLPAFNPGAGQAILQELPFARPAINGLASQVPAGAGQQALGAANALRPATNIGASAAGRVFTPQAGQIARSLPGQAARALTGAGGAGGKLATAGRFGARAVTPMVSGFAADRIFGEGDESIGQQAGRGFVRGAGWGVPAAAALASTGIGVAGLPLVAAASAITGTIGAALDVLDAGKWFGGGGDKEEAVDPDMVLANVLSTASLPPELNAQILDTYAIQMELASTIEDKDLRAQTEAQALQSAAGMAIEALGQRDQATGAASNTLALQAQSQDIFGPIAQDIRDSSMMYANAMKGIMGDLPEDYRAIAQLQTARELTSADKLANAYMAQAAIAPTVNQLTQYQQDYNSFAAQQFAQAMAQQAGGASPSYGASAQDIQALLTP